MWITYSSLVKRFVLYEAGGVVLYSIYSLYWYICIVWIKVVGKCAFGVTWVLVTTVYNYVNKCSCFCSIQV